MKKMAILFSLCCSASGAMEQSLQEVSLSESDSAIAVRGLSALTEIPSGDERSASKSELSLLALAVQSQMQVSAQNIREVECMQMQFREEMEIFKRGIMDAFAARYLPTIREQAEKLQEYEQKMLVYEQRIVEQDRKISRIEAENRSFREESERGIVLLQMELTKGYTELGHAVFGAEIDFIVPLMTSYSQDGYEVSASSEYPGAYYAHQAFNNGDAFWASKPGDTKGSWIQIKLPTPKVSNVVVLASYHPSATECTPDIFQIQASQDGSSFRVLKEIRTGWCVKEEQIISFKNDTSNLFYRIFIERARDNPHNHVGFTRVNFGIFKQ